MPDHHILLTTLWEDLSHQNICYSHVLICNDNRAKIILSGNMIIYVIATVINNYNRATDFLEFQKFSLPCYRIGTPATFFRHIKLLYFVSFTESLPLLGTTSFYSNCGCRLSHTLHK